MSWAWSENDNAQRQKRGGALQTLSTTEETQEDGTKNGQNEREYYAGLTKPLPHAPEAERAILGSILLNNTLISAQASTVAGMVRHK